MMSHMHLITLPRADPKKNEAGTQTRERDADCKILKLRVSGSKGFQKVEEQAFFSRIEDMQNR